MLPSSLIIDRKSSVVITSDLLTTCQVLSEREVSANSWTSVCKLQQQKRKEEKMIGSRAVKKQVYRRFRSKQFTAYVLSIINSYFFDCSLFFLSIFSHPAVSETTFTHRQCLYEANIRSISNTWCGDFFLLKFLLRFLLKFLLRSPSQWHKDFMSQRIERQVKNERREADNILQLMILEECVFLRENVV